MTYSVTKLLVHEIGTSTVAVSSKKQNSKNKSYHSADMIPVRMFSSHVVEVAERLAAYLEKPRTVKNVKEYCCSYTWNHALQYICLFLKVAYYGCMYKTQRLFLLYIIYNMSCIAN